MLHVHIYDIYKLTMDFSFTYQMFYLENSDLIAVWKEIKINLLVYT